ncbi:MAG: NUDIX domain-containing protein, partial [Rhodovibrionaceae bacterium]
AWAGLGYYARARNLHRCAREVAETHGGRFPETEEALRGLPGIGPYTAAAVAAIAFGLPATPVDGNIERVVARLFAVETPLPAAKPEIARLAGRLTPAARAGDHAQAMMDLGATVCTPRKPKCLACPLREFCAAQARGIAESLPRKAKRAVKPLRRGVAFWLLREDGAVLLRRRPEEGLLGGMMEVPSTPWREAAWGAPEAGGHAPHAAEWRNCGAKVKHTFTHFQLELELWVAQTAAPGRTLNADSVREGVWVPIDELGNWALPSVMRKVIRAALAETAGRTAGKAEARQSAARDPK